MPCGVVRSWHFREPEGSQHWASSLFTWAGVNDWKRRIPLRGLVVRHDLAWPCAEVAERCLRFLLRLWSASNFVDSSQSKFMCMCTEWLRNGFITADGPVSLSGSVVNREYFSADLMLCHCLFCFTAHVCFNLSVNSTPGSTPGSTRESCATTSGMYNLKGVEDRKL